MYDALGSLLERWRVDTVLPVVRGRLLDIGCGRNRVVRRYDGEGVGVDILDWGDADLVVEDAAVLPWPDGEFDTITIVAALNHMPNRKAVIREAARLLKPGGTVVVTMIPPGVSRVWHWLRAPWDPDQKHRPWSPGEVYGFRYSAMVRLFEDNGFQLVSRVRFMLWINSLYVFRKAS